MKLNLQYDKSVPCAQKVQYIEQMELQKGAELLLNVEKAVLIVSLLCKLFDLELITK